MIHQLHLFADQMTIQVCQDRGHATGGHVEPEGLRGGVRAIDADVGQHPGFEGREERLAAAARG
jgi:hypothetical protein